MPKAALRMSSNRRYHVKTVLRILLLSLLTACSTTSQHLESEPVESSNAVSANTLAKQLLDEAYEAQLRASPISASMRGLREYDALVSDLSDQARELWYQGIEHRLQRARDLLSKAELAQSRRLDLELLILKGEDALRLRRFEREEQRLTQLNGLQTWLMQLPSRLPITSNAHRMDYLVRLQKLGGMIEQEIELLRRGLSKGNTPPKAVLEGVDEQVKTMLDSGHLEDPLSHPLLSPFKTETASEAQIDEAKEIFLRVLAPSIKSYQAFVLNEYLPKTRDTLAALDLPDGEALYGALIKHYTTTDRSPAEIHELGLSEVKRIREQMFEVMRRSPWAEQNDEAELSFSTFLSHLRTNASFYFSSEEEMLREYAVIAKEVDLYLSKIFRELPRLPFGLEKMNPAIAERAPTAYYYSGSAKNGKPGRFIVNTSKLSERPKYEMRALALHEAEPGHHLQIALAQELEAQGLHPWRETLSFTVFVEGWALYAEQLGYEMGPETCGLYCDPYDQFGQLAYEMWRALRLVVDTGIHAKGWSREEAVEYMLANSSMSPHNARAEVDRYIAWPGQALAYKIGELEINALRQQAEQRLGAHFDIRTFHDEVLKRGALPLSLLRKYVEAWIEQGG